MRIVNTKGGFATFVALSLLTFCALPARAQWVQGGVGMGAQAIAPSAGSILIGGGGSAYRFTEAGVQLQMLTLLYGGPASPDGVGGLVAVSSYASSLYGIRVTSSGSRPWGPTGMTITNSFYDFGQAAICGDGTGAGFAVWTDDRTSGTTGRDIYAQKVSAAGMALWTANGVALNTYAANQDYPQVVSDGSGGAIFVWSDGDIYAQRVSSAGTVTWQAQGVPIVFGFGIQEAPIIVADGVGGAIIAWIDYRNGPRALYAQRINASGVVQWAANGISVSSPVGANIYGPVMTSDGSNGAILAWEIRPFGGTGDIYAQRLGPAGTAQWTAGGIVVADGSQNQTGTFIGSDAGGALITWNDGRYGGNAAFAQRLDGAGTPGWTANGVLVDLNVIPGYITPDGAGGAYLLESGALQRLYSDGTPAWVPNYTPAVTVADEPADQGGWVQLRFQRPPNEGVSYHVWRRVASSSPDSPEALAGPRLAISAAPPGATRIETASGTVIGFPPGTWESFGIHPALHLADYILTAPTHDDSTANGTAADDFLVTNYLSASLWVVSPVASGHSVDNLPPAMPVNFAGSVTGDHTAQLHWQGNGERDLYLYRVYRGTSESFVPAPENLIGAPTSPTWTDAGFDPGISHYKVCALDVHGNVSGFALLTPSQITGVGGNVPRVSFLARPAPNPARSRVSLEFGLARSEHASLDVIDARGRIVRRLVDADVEAGTRRWTWDGRDGAGRDLAAGIYWVVLRTPSIKQVQRVVWLD
jgi:hypothetical protein